MTTAGEAAGSTAVLFDMDGLLVDSEPLWTVAETELAAKLGGVWDDDVKAACVGHRLDAAVPIGTTCRLCERLDCDQRAFPALQFGMTIDENVRGRSFFAPALVDAPPPEPQRRRTKS